MSYFPLVPVSWCFRLLSFSYTWRKVLSDTMCSGTLGIFVSVLIDSESEDFFFVIIFIGCYMKRRDANCCTTYMRHMLKILCVPYKKAWGRCCDTFSPNEGIWVQRNLNTCFKCVCYSLSPTPNSFSLLLCLALYPGKLADMDWVTWAPTAVTLQLVWPMESISRGLEGGRRIWGI